jgi:PucR C-terminal helix-turn-helix domain
VARSRRSPVTSAPVAGKRAVGRGGRAERVERLLVGESLDTSRLSYDFEAQHVGLVAVGADARAVVEERTGTAAPLKLFVEGPGGAVWGWIGNLNGFEPVELDRLSAPERAADLRLAIGEPAQGLAGWRLSHNQARAALAVATRDESAVVRYSDVAVLASVIRDELLSASLRRIYLEPLEAERNGGEELRQTLRAYFAANRNVSVAGAEIGVTRQAVSRRLRTIEERLGRRLSACGADLEVALRLEALEAEPTPLSAP